MCYKAVFLLLFSLFGGAANANWIKVSDVDYTWGPFNIYHITLFTETGKYTENVRPLMLTLQYKKPWEGRDFAASLARAWMNLGINLPSKETDTIINHLRKTFPDIKPEDTLHYIALEDRGYFILNDKVVSNEFNKKFNDAIVAIWLDPKMERNRPLLGSTEILNTNKSESKAQNNVEQESDKINEDLVKMVSSKEVEQAQLPLLGEIELIETQTLKNEEKITDIEQTIEEKEIETEWMEFKKREKITEENTEIKEPEVFVLPIYDDILMLLKNYS